MVLRMMLAGLIVTVATGGAVATAGLLQVSELIPNIQVTPFEKKTIDQPPPGGPQTILLVGSDHRFSDPGKDARSDTLMLVRLDPSQSAITVLSIPRDLAVTIPGHGLAKINESYTDGGLDLTTRTIKTLLSTPGHPFKINHAIATTFGGFVKAVNQIGCVYIDVDRRYYHSNLGLPVSERYSEIDIKAGYQKLCGQDALAYVRFRHLDNDLVRSARQQGFLRAAKDQLNHAGVLKNLKPLVRIFGKATEGDQALNTTKGILRLAKLAVYSAGKPVVEIHFPATLVAQSSPATSPLGTPATTSATAALGDYVTTTPAQLKKVVNEFMHPAPVHKVAAKAPGAHGPATQRASTTSSAGLQNALPQVRALAQAAPGRHSTHMPVYGPGLISTKTTIPMSTQLAPNPRRYVLPDLKGHKHAAYRITMAQDAVRAFSGEYWGVEGTTWRNPPILDAVHQTRRVGGRTMMLYTDGGRIRLVAWRTPKAVYWVANTLSLDLTNRQMLGIAGSLTLVRAK
jgi:polyisoprenyl-teichoic acid--peptidoglycan teichoic acid transferase